MRLPDCTEPKMSKTDDNGDWPGKRIDFASFTEALAARRDALGAELVIPRNSGARRTASKKALLAAIEETGKRW